MAPEHDPVRRALLRRAVALGVVGPGLLAACAEAADRASGPAPTGSGPSSSTRATTTTTTTTTAATSTAPDTLAFDPDLPYWVQGGFRPVTTEIDAVDLEVDGALPPGLDGLYVRNGSNGLAPTAHWFFGEGMVHGVRLAGGQALWYRNRWVRTPVYEAAVAGTAAPGIPGREVSQSNVSVYAHGGHLWSLGEIGWPVELDPADLSTVGPVDLGGALGPNLTAHPKRDPETGLLHAFGYGLLEPPYLTYYVISADGTRIEHATPIETGASTMIHDFAITDRDVVFWEGPVLFDLDLALAGEPIPYRWDPDYGARVGVMPLGGDGSEIRWVELDPFYVFHGTNAVRRGDTITVDVSELPDFFADDDGIDGPSLLTRWTIDLSGEHPTFARRRLSDLPLDLPGIDRRLVGRGTRRAWYVTTRTDGPELWFEGITGVDLATGATDAWWPGPAEQPNEPFFVPDPDAGPEEGWLLTYVWDRATDTSSLVVLDAGDVAAGPVARVRLPQRVPFGFHADFVRL